MGLGSEILTEMLIEEAIQEGKNKRLAARGIWRTKTGEELEIGSMTTSYIINCIAMIQRIDKTDFLLPHLLAFQKELAKRGVEV